MKRGKDLISQNNLSLFKKRTFNVSKNVLGFVELLVSATALARLRKLIPICGESGVEPVVTACLSGESPSNSYQKTITFFEAGDKVTAIVWKKQREWKNNLY